MTNVDCERTRAQLLTYLDCEDCEDSREEITAHLSNCPDCQGELGLEETMRKIIKRSCVEPCPEELRLKISAQLRISITTTE